MNETQICKKVGQNAQTEKFRRKFEKKIQAALRRGYVHDEYGDGEAAAALAAAGKDDREAVTAAMACA